jgi:ribose 5-phosphate isomerase A
MLSTNEIKQRVGQEASLLVHEGMTVGLGTGSTAYWFTISLAERVKKGLRITAVPTSKEVEQLARENGIPVKTLNDVDHIDITVDGADEIDPQGQLIKGGGGALLQEKLVASASRKLVIIADHTKLVQQLGKYPLPVEVITYNYKHVQRKIEQTYKIEVTLREKNGSAFITDHGHYILNCHFNKIANAALLNQELHLIPGVVETGLFINMTSSVLAGYVDGTVKKLEL